MKTDSEDTPEDETEPLTAHEDARIVGVDQIDNAALVKFEGEPEPAVFPALLLHAAKGLGKIMFERNDEEGQEPATDPGKP